MICYHFVGPQVSLGSEVLDFGRIHSGDKATKTLDIVNDSDVPAAFQVRLLLSLLNQVLCRYVNFHYTF